MKKIIGLLIVLCVTALTGIIVLRLWGIKIVSLQHLVSSGITLLLLSLFTVGLIIAYGAFFQNPKKGYSNQNGKGRAHPKL